MKIRTPVICSYFPITLQNQQILKLMVSAQLISTADKLDNAINGWRIQRILWCEIFLVILCVILCGFLFNWIDFISLNFAICEESCKQKPKNFSFAGNCTPTLQYMKCLSFEWVEIKREKLLHFPQNCFANQTEQKFPSQKPSQQLYATNNSSYFDICSEPWNSDTLLGFAFIRKLV